MLCEWCTVREATDKHHCLYHRNKRYPELNDEKNIMHVCRQCHDSGEVNSWFARIWFWGRQCERYGHDVMVAWNEGLPLKVKERFE